MRRLLLVTLVLGGCYVEAGPPQPVQPVQPPPPAYAPPPPARTAETPPPAVEYQPPPPQGSDLYVGEPEPIATEYVPPPLISELPGPEPFYGAVWISGFW